jgi:transposase
MVLCLLVYRLAAGLIPEVGVPPPPVRELRVLVARRQRRVRQRTQAANRLHSVLHAHQILVLHAHQILLPTGRLGNAGQQTWWEQLELPALERVRVEQDLPLLQTVERLIATVDAELTRLSTQDPWKEIVPCLMQLPGCAVVSSMTVLAAIGEITRFPSAKKLVGYGGLGASVHAAGQTHRTGPITTQGRRALRTVLVEAAWSAVEHHPYWHAEFARLVPPLGKGKAMVAIARKLLVVVWARWARLDPPGRRSPCGRGHGHPHAAAPGQVPQLGHPARPEQRRLRAPAAPTPRVGSLPEGRGGQRTRR